MPERTMITVIASTRPLLKRVWQWPVSGWAISLTGLRLFPEVGEQKVSDESIRDTLIDLANYAIMTVLEMEVSDHDAE